MAWSWRKTQGARDADQSADIAAARAEVSRRGRAHRSAEQTAENREKLGNLRRGMSQFDARSAAAETIARRRAAGVCLNGRGRCGVCLVCCP